MCVSSPRMSSLKVALDTDGFFSSRIQQTFTKSPHWPRPTPRLRAGYTPQAPGSQGEAAKYCKEALKIITRRWHSSVYIIMYKFTSTMKILNFIDTELWWLCNLSICVWVFKIYLMSMGMTFKILKKVNIPKSLIGCDRLLIPSDKMNAVMGITAQKRQGWKWLCLTEGETEKIFSHKVKAVTHEMV